MTRLLPVLHAQRGSIKASWPARAAAGSRPESHQGCRPPPLPDLRATTIGCPPPQNCANPCTRQHKVSDEFTVPLCRGHHREVHRCGNEAARWRNAGVDPTVAARALWLETHPLPVARDEVQPRTNNIGSTDSIPTKAGPTAARRFEPTDPIHKMISDGVG